MIGVKQPTTHKREMGALLVAGLGETCRYECVGNGADHGIIEAVGPGFVELWFATASNAETAAVCGVCERGVAGVSERGWGPSTSMVGIVHGQCASSEATRRAGVPDPYFHGLKPSAGREKPLSRASTASGRRWRRARRAFIAVRKQDTLLVVHLAAREIGYRMSAIFTSLAQYHERRSLRCCRRPAFVIRRK